MFCFLFFLSTSCFSSAAGADRWLAAEQAEQAAAEKRKKKKRGEVVHSLTVSHTTNRNREDPVNKLLRAAATTYFGIGFKVYSAFWKKIYQGYHI